MKRVRSIHPAQYAPVSSERMVIRYQRYCCAHAPIGQGVLCGSLFSWFSWTNCVSAMSHPRSGIFLVGTAFLPSLVFHICSSSYNLKTFSVMGIFLTSLWCILVVWPWLSFISTWFFPKSPIMQKSLYFGWNAFDV